MGARKQTRRPPPTSNAPALTNVRQQVEATRSFVAKYQDRVLDLMAGKEADVKRFYQTFSICLAQEPKLATCTRSSLIGALLEIAALRLEPGVMGEAWPIPFRNRQRNVTEAQVIVGYKGLMKLVRNSGRVSRIDSDVVYEKDPWDWLKGTEQYLRHKKADEEDRGKMVAAWALADVWSAHGKSMQFEVLLGREVLAIKARAPSAKAATSPWKTDEEAMWRKTALRRLCKSLPSDAESRLTRATEIDEMLDARISQNLRTRADDLPDLPVMEGEIAEPEGEGEGDQGDGDQEPAEE